MSGKGDKGYVVTKECLEECLEEYLEKVILKSADNAHNADRKIVTAMDVNNAYMDVTNASMDVTNAFMDVTKALKRQ